jgi:heme-binding NEAT domain protein
MALVGRSADIEPMKPLRIILIAFAVLIVGGTIASAAAGGVHGKTTPSPSVSDTETEAPEPTETEAPEPTETEAPEAGATTSDKSGTAPDFSACSGLTGLDNAICRHEALLKVKPDNPGLTNSLAHLQANLAAQAAGTHGKSGSHGPSGS